jgi:hypothetical protein
MNIYSVSYFWCGSCGRLSIINGSRDQIVQKILEIDETVQETVETINISRAQVKQVP